MTSPPAGPRGGALYIVHLRGERHEVVVGPEGAVVIDGRRHEASLAAAGSPGGHSLILDGASFPLLARARTRGAWELDLDGRAVPVEVLDARTAKVRELSAFTAGAAEISSLKAPMPGLVVQVAVREGDVVEPGATVLIVEAMKMENELRATAAARVERVLVTPGDPVDKGQVLVEFGEVEPA